MNHKGLRASNCYSSMKNLSALSCRRLLKPYVQVVFRVFFKTCYEYQAIVRKCIYPILHVRHSILNQLFALLAGVNVNAILKWRHMSVIPSQITGDLTVYSSAYWAMKTPNLCTTRPFWGYSTDAHWIELSSTICRPFFLALYVLNE